MERFDLLRNGDYTEDTKTPRGPGELVFPGKLIFAMEDSELCLAVKGITKYLQTCHRIVQCVNK